MDKILAVLLDHYDKAIDFIAVVAVVLLWDRVRRLSEDVKSLRGLVEKIMFIGYEKRRKK